LWQQFGDFERFIMILSFERGSFQNCSRTLGLKSLNDDPMRHGPYLFKPPNNSGLVQVVRGHFHFDAVAGGQPNPTFAHLSRYSGQHQVFVVQLHSKHRTWQNGVNHPFYFNRHFFHRCDRLKPVSICGQHLTEHRKERRRKKRGAATGPAGMNFTNCPWTVPRSP